MPYFIDNIKCQGNESNLLGCDIYELGKAVCPVGVQAAVNCRAGNIFILSYSFSKLYIAIF